MLPISLDLCKSVSCFGYQFLFVLYRKQLPGFLWYRRRSLDPINMNQDLKLNRFLHTHPPSTSEVLTPLIFARCGWCLYTSFMLVEKHFKHYNSLTSISFYCWQQAGFLHTKDLRPWLFCQRDITETLVHLLMCSIITLHFVDRLQDLICCRPSASTRCCQKHYGEVLLSCCLSSD